MINEDKIRKQYEERQNEFARIKDELRATLRNVASRFYQKTRFKVIIPEPRLKTVESVLSKMRRKGITADSLFHEENDKLSLVVNDFLGARIACNTREDVSEIRNLLTQNPRLTLKKEDSLDKPSGYRAVHLDMSYEAYWNDIRVSIPVETQIKTHLQHAWAEITHDESYKPEDTEIKNEWEHQYSKHMADVLDILDNMASTIRKQRLNVVRPPNEIDDSDTIINPKTLSYKVDLLKRGQRLTQQEMTLAISRLKEEGFVTLAEAGELLQDTEAAKQIKEFKEKLLNNENVHAFELLYYGALLKRGSESKFKDEMRKDFGFVQDQCRDCDRFLSKEEYQFIKEQTDSDISFYCGDHRMKHFPNQCSKCRTYTSGDLCKNCEAETSSF